MKIERYEIYRHAKVCKWKIRVSPPHPQGQERFLPLQKRKRRDPKGQLGCGLNVSLRLEIRAQRNGRTGKNGSSRDSRQLLVQSRMPTVDGIWKHKSSSLRAAVSFLKTGAGQESGCSSLFLFSVNKLVKSKFKKERELILYWVDNQQSQPEVKWLRAPVLNAGQL